MPTFFLSSASGDDDPYVAQFCGDLANAVARNTDDFGPDDAFLGTAGPSLRAWPPGMAHSLARCDVFVALCSQRYFLNEACGRQWQVVLQRMRSGVQPGGGPILLALPWTLDGEIPPHADAGVVRLPTYPQRGLRQLTRLHSLRQTYAAYVDEVARAVVAAPAARPAAPASVPAFQTTASAFQRTGPAADGTGSPFVHLVVAAGTRREMARVPERDNLSFYGVTSSEWMPYQPGTTEPIAERAQSVAAEHLLESEIGSLDDVLEHIERARQADEIVVVLVDWWATKLDAYRQVLAEIDRRGLSGTAVLVPTSPADEDTVRNHDELRYALRWAFRNAAGGPRTSLRTEIDTPERFDAELAGAIEEARNRIFRDGRVHQLLSGEPPGDRPILRGP